MFEMLHHSEPHVQDASADSKETTIEHLESISASILNLMNARDYTSPLYDHLSPVFITEFEGRIVATTREQHIEERKAVVKQNPGIQMEITDIASNVDEAKGLATVWAMQKVTNPPYDVLERESVKMLIWEKRNGSWICLKHVGMRGCAVL